jgi:nitrile hydratase
VPVPARFRAGDPVQARNVHPVGHTRLPRYVRGRRGVVDRDHGVFVFPDTNALGLGPKPQHVYAVRFPARELWGAVAPARDAVYVDLWDDHLEAVAAPGAGA